MASWSGAPVIGCCAVVELLWIGGEGAGRPAASDLLAASCLVAALLAATGRLGKPDRLDAALLVQLSIIPSGALVEARLVPDCEARGHDAPA